MESSKHDIDAGAEKRSVGQDEPHRPHDKEDRGGLYARQQDGQRPQPRRYDRKDMEGRLPLDPDPDDPVR